MDRYKLYIRYDMVDPAEKKKNTLMKKILEEAGACVNEEIYQDNPAPPNFPNYPQAVCPPDLDQEKKL